MPERHGSQRAEEGRGSGSSSSRVRLVIRSIRDRWTDVFQRTSCPKSTVSLAPLLAC